MFPLFLKFLVEKINFLKQWLFPGGCHELIPRLTVNCFRWLYFIWYWPKPIARNEIFPRIIFIEYLIYEIDDLRGYEKMDWKENYYLWKSEVYMTLIGIMGVLLTRLLCYPWIAYSWPVKGLPTCAFRCDYSSFNYTGSK